MSQTKRQDDSQSIANFIPFFGYTETNLDFAPEPGFYRQIPKIAVLPVIPSWFID